jgi:hypothetical protein
MDLRTVSRLRCRNHYQIAVEYFGQALDYLRAHPMVAPGGIIVMGVSKGSEAALLTGSTHPTRCDR